ncbi:MAG TPA: hypothetical protein VMV95_03770 [Bacillota bacterium]|nr:hypothetical protein [Bacillota bacterium]
MKKKVVQDEKFYKFFEGDAETFWIDKRRGTGKILTHFLKNKGTLINLETIEKISGWKDSKKQMRGYLMPIINNWSPYKIERIKEGERIEYKLTSEK